MTAIINTKLAALLKKLEAAEASVAKIKADIAAVDKPAPAKGDEVSFVFGRGDNKVTYTGTALKVSAGENGVAYVTVLVEIDGEPTTKRVPVKDVTITKPVPLDVDEAAPVSTAAIAEVIIEGDFDKAVEVADPIPGPRVVSAPVEALGDPLAGLPRPGSHDHGSNVNALLAG